MAPADRVLVFLARLLPNESPLILRQRRVFEKVLKHVARWARVNTLLLSVEDCLAELEALGWEKVETPANREDFVKLVRSLGEAQFVVDIDFPYVVAFPNSVVVTDYVGSLVNDKKLLLQDKASCIPASVLKPRPGSHVIDACAAPGLKTLHLAALMGDTGRVTAIELNKERFEVLKQYVEIGCGEKSIVEAKNVDFLSLNPDDYEDVEFIMVDPSCSGTGIAKREDKLMGETVCEKRLRKLSGFQVKILLHALNFPNVKRVVYSTCSVMPEENEHVVRDVLAKPGISSRFRLKDFGRSPAGNQWEPACEEFFQCKQTSTKRDLCNGFFVAAFQRRNSKKGAE